MNKEGGRTGVGGMRGKGGTLARLPNGRVERNPDQVVEFGVIGDSELVAAGHTSVVEL